MAIFCVELCELYVHLIMYKSIGFKGIRISNTVNGNVPDGGSVPDP